VPTTGGRRSTHFGPSTQRNPSGGFQGHSYLTEYDPAVNDLSGTSLRPYRLRTLRTRTVAPTACCPRFSRATIKH
jgi:hypothetical protein